MTEKAEFEMLLAEAKITGGVPETFDAVEYLRGKIAEIVVRTNSYDPEIADNARKEVIQWLVILDLVEKPAGGFSVDDLEKELTKRLKSAFKADFDALEKRIETLETADKVDALEKRLAEIESVDFDGVPESIEKRLADLEKAATAPVTEPAEPAKTDKK